ncbi:hypothetical protein [Flavobacterium sp. ACAM 123]|jgi:hypothetical protein|uniref:hypothetical protein n=1 Tax=Flavobacterium sp. ACAM 123 TaxID=1189620 RepID=UPI00036516AE|nr:hypothetical protein [Flavobacterium sp. ACAM 123]
MERKCLGVMNGYGFPTKELMLAVFRAWLFLVELVKEIYWHAEVLSKVKVVLVVYFEKSTEIVPILIFVLCF